MRFYIKGHLGHIERFADYCTAQEFRARVGALTGSYYPIEAVTRPNGVTDSMETLLRNHQKFPSERRLPVTCIKMIREVSGLGLKEAKDYWDSLA